MKKEAKNRNQSVMRILLCAFCAMMIMQAQAQLKVGQISIVPRVGVSVSRMTASYFPSSNVTWNVGSKARSSFAGGVDAWYQASDLLALSLGVGYEEGGCRFDDYEISADKESGEGQAWHDAAVKLRYLTLPVMGHLYIAPGLSVNAGLRAGWLVDNRAQQEIQHTRYDKENGRWAPTNNEKIVDDDDSYYNGMELSLPLGVSYEVQHVILDARYEIGLTKLYKHGLSDAHGGRLNVTVGYRIDL